MQVLVNTDNHIIGTPELTAEVADEVQTALKRFAKQITRVEVHLQDVNSHKQGTADKRCVMEARLAGLDPIAVTDESADLSAAVSGAAKKLQRMLDRTVGKLHDR